MKRRPRPTLKAPETLEAVIGRAGEDRFARAKPPVGERIWRDAVGLRIAERARPVALERGVLTLRVATSVWANELSLLAPTILERLRAQRVPVTELRFRVGPVEAPPRPPERRTTRAVPTPAPLPIDLARALSGVDDDELRTAIADAASANLAWRAYVEPPEITSASRLDGSASLPRAPAAPAADARDARASEAPRDARAPRSAGTESDPRGRR